jgi:hypothetical protein
MQLRHLDLSGCWSGLWPESTEAVISAIGQVNTHIHTVLFLRVPLCARKHLHPLSPPPTSSPSPSLPFSGPWVKTNTNLTSLHLQASSHPLHACPSRSIRPSTYSLPATHPTHNQAAYTSVPATATTAATAATAADDPLVPLVCDTLCTLKSLSSLRLSGHFLGPGLALAIALSLGVPPPLPTTTPPDPGYPQSADQADIFEQECQSACLRDLDLSGNGVGPAGLQVCPLC